MRTFEFATDPTGDLGGALYPPVNSGRIDLDADTLRVTLGAPPVFDMSIPRSAIKRVERRPDLRRVTRGAHGMRGKWLVNRSGSNLVRLYLASAVPAALTLHIETVSEGRQPKNWLSRALFHRLTRDRTVKVRELTISVDDPDEFIGVLSQS